MERSRLYRPRTRRARPVSCASRVSPPSSRSASHALEKPPICPRATPWALRRTRYTLGRQSRSARSPCACTRPPETSAVASLSCTPWVDRPKRASKSRTVSGRSRRSRLPPWIAPSPARAGAARRPEARTVSSATPPISRISGRTSFSMASGSFAATRASSSPSAVSVPDPDTEPSFASRRNGATEAAPCAQRIWTGPRLSHVSVLTTRRIGSIDSTPSPRRGSPSGTRPVARADSVPPSGTVPLHSALARSPTSTAGRNSSAESALPASTTRAVPLAWSFCSGKASSAR